MNDQVSPRSYNLTRNFAISALIVLVLAPFSQIDDSLARQRDGTGLGLTLSRDFAVLLGGTLEINGNPGRCSLGLKDSSPPPAAPPLRSARDSPTVNWASNPRLPCAGRSDYPKTRSSSVSSGSGSSIAVVCNG